MTNRRFSESSVATSGAVIAAISAGVVITVMILVIAVVTWTRHHKYLPAIKQVFENKNIDWLDAMKPNAQQQLIMDQLNASNGKAYI